MYPNQTKLIIINISANYSIKISLIKMYHSMSHPVVKTKTVTLIFVCMWC